MLEKIKTLLWFIKRPEMYSQMLSLLSQRISPNSMEDTREEATQWCHTHATDTQAFLASLGLTEIASLAESHPEAITYAESKVSLAPSEMGGMADLDLLYNITLYKKPSSVLETGVAHGGSSLAILAGLQKIGSGELYSTDMPYPKMNNESFVGAAVPEDLRKHWTLVRKPDRAGLKDIFQKTDYIELCHYDSDKSYVGRKWAYPRIWSRLAKNGIFISDDIQDNVAFREFVEELGLPYSIIYYPPEDKYIGIVVKN